MRLPVSLRANRVGVLFGLMMKAPGLSGHSSSVCSGGFPCREIAAFIQLNGYSQSTSGTPAQTLATARLPNSVKGDTSATMEKLQLNVPDLWADHHVLKVRAILTAMPGVQDVVASSAFRMVALSYDPAVVGPGAIMGALDDAGYSVATDGTGVIAETVPIATGQRDPAWFRLGMRQQKTDERDLKTKR
jgi:copper chaperone CopZ